jgi:integration host factor subunit beta
MGAGFFQTGANAIQHTSFDMTRSDLVEELANRFAQLTHRDAELAVKTVLDAMSDALVRGHRIEIRGFGSFSINRRPPRVGRNPRSGESVQIPEKRVPHFKPGKALREAVDAGTPVSARSQD